MNGADADEQLKTKKMMDSSSENCLFLYEDFIEKQYDGKIEFEKVTDLGKLVMCERVVDNSSIRCLVFLSLT